MASAKATPGPRKLERRGSVLTSAIDMRGADMVNFASGESLLRKSKEGVEDAPSDTDSSFG